MMGIMQYSAAPEPEESHKARDNCPYTSNSANRRPPDCAAAFRRTFSNGLVDVTYVCETCVIHTIRTIKSDDKGLI